MLISNECLFVRRPFFNVFRQFLNEFKFLASENKSVNVNDTLLSNQVRFSNELKRIKANLSPRSFDIFAIELSDT